MVKQFKRYCVQFFSVLANPLRIAILQSLLENPKNVNELTAHVGEERTLVSHNLALLRDVNLITFRKKGKERIYHAEEKATAPIFFLMENFTCPGCSLRNTCNTLKERGFGVDSITSFTLKTCKGCK